MKCSAFLVLLLLITVVLNMGCGGGGGGGGSTGGALPSTGNPSPTPTQQYSLTITTRTGSNTLPSRIVVNGNQVSNNGSYSGTFNNGSAVRIVPEDPVSYQNNQYIPDNYTINGGQPINMAENQIDLVINSNTAVIINYLALPPQP